MRSSLRVLADHRRIRTRAVSSAVAGRGAAAGDELLLALAHRGIGVGLSRTAQLADGLDHLQRTLQLADQSGDSLTQARVHRSLALTRAWQGDIGQAAGDPARAHQAWSAESLYTAQHRIADAEITRGKINDHSGSGANG